MKLVIREEDFKKMVDDGYVIVGTTIQMSEDHPELNMARNCGCDKCLKYIESCINDHTFHVEIINE